MLDQLFELSRKAAESSLQVQQAMFKFWTQDVMQTSGTDGISADFAGTMRKRWIDLSLDALHKHRESLHSTYEVGIQAIEKALRVSDAKSSEEVVHTVEDVWRRLFDAFKGQSEAQFREFQTWAEKSFAMARKPEV